MMNTIFKKMAALAIVITIAGCAQMPISSLLKLRNVDPRKTDLTVLQVAVQMPMVIIPRGDGIFLEVLEKAQNSNVRKHRFVLEPQPNAAFVDELQSFRKPDRKIIFFKLSPGDVVAFDQLRNSTNEDGSAKKMELSVQTLLCRLVANDVGSIPISVFLKTEETMQFIPLVIDKNFAAIGGENSTPLCR